ncbi:MAG: 30S ribosomal protein S2 [Patescibacteria group bacterium]|nr:30S ribosomal protein S2 [Patescibacteria group bacterium]
MAAKTQEKNNPLIDKLFSAGAHFGYTKTRRHPSVSRFIFGSKGSVELFNLEQTAACLENALGVLKDFASKRQTVLFVGAKAEARGALERVARRLNQPYVSGRWIGGTLTNWSEVKKRLARLAELTTMRDKGELTKFTKLERLLIDREITDLEAMFGGLRGLERPPAALFVVDPRHEHTAVTEARKMGLPVIALMNSDCDASEIAHPIPGNDASRQTIEFVLEEVAKAFEAGGVAAAQAASV